MIHTYKINTFTMLRLLHIGLGSWGPNVARNFQRVNGIQVEFLCDIDKDRYNAVQYQFPGARFAGDYRSVLRDGKIDAVSIASHAESHYEIARESIEGGKHVFAEKPLSLSSEECFDLYERSVRKNVILMVGHVFLYNPAVRKLKELFESGELGELYYMYSQRLNLGRVRQDVDVVWNFAPHDISILMYLLGENVESVSASGISVLQPGTCDVAFIKLKTESGKDAHVHVSWIDPNKVRKMTVVGSRKMVVYDDTAPDRKIRIFDKGIDKRTLDASFGEFDNFGSFQFLQRAGDIYVPKIDSTEPLYNECRHFADCIAQGKQPRTDGIHGLRVVEALEAVTKSMVHSGEVTKVNHIHI